MATVFFSNGTTAEVENIRGANPRTFTIADRRSEGAFLRASKSQSKLSFVEGGDVYLIERIDDHRVTVVPQIS